MNSNVLNSIILIELQNVKPENLGRLLSDNGISDKLNVERLISIKEMGISKIFIDSNSFETVAFVRSENPDTLIWEGNFISKMLDMKGIKFEGQKKLIGERKLDVNTILDKINEHGYDSLTSQEKDFLKKIK